MLDAVMYPFDGPFVFDDDTIIPPFGFEFSLSRDEDMIVWKKVLVEKIKYNDYREPYYEHVIVKLKIPKDASVVFTPSKCRASRALVLGFYPCAYGGQEYELAMTSAMAWYDHSFKYNLGEEISPDCFDRDWRKTCSHGIHFFRTFEEAVGYVF
mgnify:CR=1 FL=1